MTIRESVSQGWLYARTCKSLWLFGFFVGVTSGGSSGGSSGGGGASAGGGAGSLALGLAGIGGFPGQLLIAVAAVVLVLVLAGIVLRMVSEGALIEGIARIRHGGTITTREGWRQGWAHWGVLLRIALLYIVTTIASVLALVAPCVLAARLLGWPGGIVFGLVTLAVAVPWLVTLYLVQAFASRIAVLENRRAFDAIHKARLFLHGRILQGLKLIVATFLGTLAIVVVGLAVIVPVVLLFVVAARLTNGFLVLVTGCLLIAPVLAVLAAMVGTFRSSVWTIGYLAEQEA